ncbi:MAG: tetratricopeptide repeat protein [Thermoguttaceae bacterium]|nr:tetratricopeptide repeat protein [Thermoguttaceae bacterium]MDW8037807.1 tetratricopeptide repeat protein [Thermoguttaceae bacterium]
MAKVELRQLTEIHWERIHSRFCWVGCVAIWCLAAALSYAQQMSPQDVVEWNPGGAGSARARLSGQVLEYTGQLLFLRLPDGREQKIPAQKVLRVHTQYSPLHQEAEERFQLGRFTEALHLYRKAIEEEPRRWVRRQMLARMVVCYEETGQATAAGETFLLLVQSDPDTLYWEVIPLAWLPGVPDVGLERQAKQWLAQDPEQAPAAVLLGASHLLSGPDRATALQRLNTLVRHPDPRIALLALAQTWRSQVQVEPAQLEVWERTIQKLPAGLRAGPYYVLGRALAHQDRWEEAALAWMRIPILYGRPRSLAARALVEAGAALQRLGQTEQAARLYKEVLAKYPDTASGSEASQRLHELQKQPASATSN